MKAPEIIYCWRGVVGSFYASPQEQKDIETTEYIRKDISDETIKTAEDHAYFAGQEKFREKLLEWAKETYLNENASAIRKVCYKQVIDKLNSM